MLVLRADDRIEQLEVREGTEKRKRKEHRVALGVLEPQEQRTLSVSGRVCSPIPDGAELRFGACVSAAECAPFELEELRMRVRARPRFTPSNT